MRSAALLDIWETETLRSAQDDKLGRLMTGRGDRYPSLAPPQEIAACWAPRSLRMTNLEGWSPAVWWGSALEIGSVVEIK
jgi:hypothetical protein